MKDGGPAFPTTQEYQRYDDDKDQYVTDHLPGGGMTLRDYFAANAIPSLWPHYYNNPDQAAQESYKIADAMLKAREGK